MKFGDFVAQIFHAPDQANPPDKIAVGVEESRRKKTNNRGNHPGPGIKHPPQHLPIVALRRQVIPLAENFSECPRRRRHFFE